MPAAPLRDQNSKLNLRDALIVAAACACFLALTLYQIREPGLYYDEAWDAVSTMQIVHGLPVELERGAHITLLGRAWPLMLDDYQGIISTYLLVPFFLVGGIGVYSIRAFSIFSGLLALVLCYFLARAWFGRSAALVATWLFAVAPSWVFWSRIGVYVVSEVVPITLGALLAFTAWWRAPRGRTGWLALGSFLLGLGLATKLLYVWPILAVPACYILLYGRTLWQRRRLGLRALRPAWAVPTDGGRRTTDEGDQHSALSTQHSALSTQYSALGALVLAMLCFGLGSFTFLAYNWQTQGTYLKILSSVTQTEYGANSTTVLPNLWEEMDRFRVVLDGSYFWFQTANALPETDPLAPLAFLLAGGGLLVAAIRALPYGGRGAWPARRALGTVGVVSVAVLALWAGAFVVPNSRDPALLVPVALVVLAATVGGGALLAAALRRPATWARWAGGVLLVATVVGGATWLLTGAPDGQARGPLDLRLADTTGLLFWISLGEMLLLLGWSAPATRWQRPLVATLGFLAAVLVQSFPTLSGLWPTHLVVMLPLPQILVGAAVAIGVRGWRLGVRDQDESGTRNRQSAARWRAIAAGAVVLALLGSSLWTDVRYHEGLAQTGGLFAFSDAIYSLENYLAKAPRQPIIAAEWGIRRPVQILSNGRLDAAEIFQYGPGNDPATIQAFDAALNDTLKLPDARYIFTADGIGPYNRFAEFQHVLASRGLVPFLEHVSYMADGRAMYEVYTARPTAAPR